MSTYYAVYIEQLSDKEQDTDNADYLVFHSLPEVVTYVRKLKSCKARFKSFDNFDDAMNYARLGPQEQKAPATELEYLGSPMPSRTEPSDRVNLSNEDLKSTELPAPSRSELAKLRKAIERFDDETVESLVWSNPRFLVNYNNDSPMIIFEGCRYNALHVAAKCGNLFVCELVLRLMGADGSPPTYLEPLYSEEDMIANERRQRFLLDMYVNTPDKVLHETPLHFASKNAHWPVAKLLYSLPICIRNARNKYGETPAQLARNREDYFSCGDNSIFRLDDDQNFATSFYVGLYRTDDCSTPPYVRPPSIGFPPTELPRCHTNDGFHKVDYYQKPVERLVAYVGPLNIETAKCLYAEWSGKKAPHDRRAGNFDGTVGKLSETKTPLSHSPAYSAKKSNLQKGAEVLGRELALRYNGEWCEFWSFLNKFCDLSSLDGLQALEDYFLRAVDHEANLAIFNAETLTQKLMSLPSPFFHDGPRTPRKKIRTRLDFDSPIQSTEKSTEPAEHFYDVFEHTTADHSSDSDSELDFITPPETPPLVFIGGDYPSKTDFDVYEVISHLELDRLRFPHIQSWKHRMDAIVSSHPVKI